MTFIPHDEDYGTELTLRLSAVTDRAALADGEAVANFLRRLVSAVGMRVIAGPAVGTEEGPPHRAGQSAVVILAESHAAVHTYPALGEVFFNLFSCKPFAEETVLAEFRAFVGHFAVTEYTSTRRGEDWPRTIDRAMRHWRSIRPRDPAFAGP